MAKLRVNFNKGLRMDLACATDELRPAMNCIHFENGYAYASDGHILVKNFLSECTSIPEEQIEKLNGKNIHRDAYKQIIKYDEIIISEDGIEANKGEQKAFFYFDKTETKYPDAESVINMALNDPPVPVGEIGIKTELLIKMNKALYGSSGCKYQFKGENKNIVLQSIDTDSLGIIMPVYIMR